MKTFTRRRRTRLAVLGLTSLAVIGIASTTMLSLALFTDDATLDNNTFTAGTIELSTTPSTALFTVTGMMPGDVAYGQLTVSNDGSGDLRYAMTSSSTDPDSLALAAALNVEIREKAAGTCSADFTGTVVLASSPLSTAAFGDSSAGQDTDDRVLAASATEDVCFMVSLPGPTGDSYQGATTTTTFTFQAEQTANNA